MRLIIEENDAKAGLWTARYIVARIKEKAARTDRPFVLGLPTGSTPVETYKGLVRLYQAEQGGQGVVRQCHYVQYGRIRGHPRRSP